MLKRLGHATPISESTADTKFDALFGGQPKDDEALHKLFPNGKITIRNCRVRRRVTRTCA